MTAFSLAIRAAAIYITPQSYSVKDLGVRTRRQLIPTKQSALGEMPTDGIANKGAANTCPARAKFGSSRFFNFHIAGVTTNLGVTTSHCVLDADMIAVSGRVGAVFPVKRVETAAQVPANFTNCCYVTGIPGRDGCFIVFPKATNLFLTIIQHFVKRAQDPDTLLGNCLVTIPWVLKFVDRDGQEVPNWGDRVPGTPLCKFTEFPLGDVDAATDYDDGTQIGIFVETSVPTRAGQCGQLAYTTNTRVGEGSRIYFGLHCGYLDGYMKAVICPLAAEDIEEFVAQCPGVSKIQYQGRPEFVFPVTHCSDSPRRWYILEP